MNEIRTRIAGIILKDNKILMLRGKNHKELWTPGGKIDGNESDLECLSRELKEEIQVELIEATFFKEYKTTSHYNPNQKLIERVYLVTIEGSISPSAEIEDFLWFSRDNYENKEYEMITLTQINVIPDLISEGIWK